MSDKHPSARPTVYRQHEVTDPPPSADGQHRGASEDPDMVAGTARGLPTGPRRKRFRVHEWGTILFFCVVFGVIAGVSGTGYLSASNIFTTLAQNAYLVFIAVGVTVPLIAGQLDLSVGAVSGLAAVLTAGLTSMQGFPLWLAILCVVLIGAVFGAVNGFLVTVVRINVFIATLGTSGVAAGIALMYAKGAVIYSGIPVSLTNFGSAHLFGNFPTILVLPAVIVLAMWFMAKRTMFGRHLYAVGSNPVSSRLAGVRVNRTIVLSLVLAGVLSALGGVVFTARFGSVDPTSGSGYLLPAFAAAFLGTAILSDGRFSIFGTFLATYLVAFAGSGLLQLGLQYSGDVFNGIVLIGAVTLNELLKRRSRSAARSIARN